MNEKIRIGIHTRIQNIGLLKLRMPVVLGGAPNNHNYIKDIYSLDNSIFTELSEPILSENAKPIIQE